MEKSFLLYKCVHPAAFLAQTRNNFVSTKQEVEKLMKRIRSADQDYKPPGQWTMEGFLYVQEKREWSAQLALSHPSRQGDGVWARHQRQLSLFTPLTLMCSQANRLER